ncbi:MAG: Gfo/Idh/MocA family oxidoreductase, partial [Flammeovirgaceae bacterium]
MSCSYGPGRYDTNYEEDGHDYPFAYVRWTEQRNMEAFLELISKGSLKIKPLISHVFDIDNAAAAYDLVLGKSTEPSIGILLRYPHNQQKESTHISVNQVQPSAITAGFIGAGSFAQSYLLPNLKGNETSLHTVVTSRGINSKNVAQKFGFGFSSSEAKDVLEQTAINTVFIATPHNSHADYVVKSLQAGKHVFVEKPLALTYDQANEVKEAYQKANKLLMVGFNRRFSDAALAIDAYINTTNEPKVMNFRINAGFLPKDHWTQKLEIGGGRILGEVCHWVDLMQFFSRSIPKSVYATAAQVRNDQYSSSDNVNINISFKDGSVGTITYTAMGDSSLEKEHLEVFCSGKVGIIHDFKKVSHYSGNREKQ